MQITNLGPAPIWIIAKIFFLVGLSVYLIFALVVVQQTRIMADTIKLEFESPIKILALIHLLLAIVLLVFAFLVL